ncbi:MAG: VanZ family protein [Proteobacteria bacterium]|nr:VanZ family protein [Pseudomonadota bacterium]
MTKIFLFAFLAGVTIFSHTIIERHEKSGPEMLTDNWGLHTSKSSKAEIKENWLYLSSSDQNQSVNIQQDISSFDRGSILKLSADMKCENVQPGEQPWNRARLLLVQHDGLKDRWDFPHLVASFTGTREWDHYNQFFTIESETKKIRVTAQLSRCTGSFQLRNIRLYPVSQTQLYTWVKRGILTLWGVFSLFLLGSCFFNGKKTIVLQAVLVIAFIAILIGTTMPADMKNQVSNEVKSQIHATSDVFENAVPWDLSKVGHFCFFALFGFILSLLMNREPVILVMINIFLLAGGTEIAQFFIDGRSPLFWDFIIDAAGGLSGILLVKPFKLCWPVPADE